MKFVAVRARCSIGVKISHEFEFCPWADLL
jgi:hypothetical protein